MEKVLGTSKRLVLVRQEQSNIDGSGLKIPPLSSVFPSLSAQYETLSPAAHRTTPQAERSDVVTAGTALENEGRYIQINRRSWHLGGHQYFDQDTRSVRDFNEDNVGLGYQKQIGDTGFSFAAGFYRGSYRDAVKYATVSYTTDSVLGNPDFGVGVEVGLLSGYKGRVDDKYLVAGRFMPAATLFVTAKIPENPLLPDGSKVKISYMPIPETGRSNSRLESVKGIAAAQLLIPF